MVLSHFVKYGGVKSTYDLSVVSMGVSRVGQEGANAPSWNLKMMTSYVVLLYKALNLSLAPSALALIHLNLA